MEISFVDIDLSDVCEEMRNINGNYINSHIIRRIITCPLFLLCYFIFAIEVIVYFIHYVFEKIYEFITDWSIESIAFVLGIAFVWLWLFLLIGSLIIYAMNKTCTFIAFSFRSNYHSIYE